MSLILIDNKIPFIEGRINDPEAAVRFLAPDEFSPEKVKDADALLVRTRTKCNESLLQGSKVSMVATATVGFDHIDREWCEAHGISAFNSAGCNAPGVAQYVWSFLLRLGFDLKGHTLGIIGYGNIGSIVAEWGRLFGVNVLVCDPPREEAGMKDEDYVSLRHLLENSDAVTVHTPLTKEGAHKTFRMIGEREISLMKPEALLINAARGGIVDEKALKKALEEGRVRAVIDVWENEPAIDSSLIPLLEGATPHIAGYSRQGKERATRMVLEALESKFGLAVDKSGLEPAYIAGNRNITPDIIVESFDPFPEMRKLAARPGDFEILRESYVYRDEPIAL